MADSEIAELEGVPAGVATVLLMFVTAARKTLSTDLVSVVVFGSAAEGRLGPTSDVNLLLVLGAISPEKLGQLRDALLAAEAAIKLRILFLLESEVSDAAEFFAQKFADILRRHRTIYGKDVLATLKVSRGAEIFRLKQILLNLVLRLREAYVLRGHRPEQVTLILAETLGPLRAACATLLEVEGAPNTDSNVALASVAAACGPQSQDAAAWLIAAHDGKPLGADAEGALFRVLEFAMRVSRRAALLK
jgi:predicted nucleotidyltransferase